jgi:glycosyltransferase involved in cell wall biosynthesis
MMNNRCNTAVAIICSIDDAKFARASASLTRSAPLGISSVIRIADARAICEAYNRGARASVSDWIVFCHDDIEILNCDPRDLRDAMASFDVFGACGAARVATANWYDADPNHLRGSVFAPAVLRNGFEHQIFSRVGPLSRVATLDGIFIACRREVWQQLMFDENLPGFHGYDFDFCYRAHLLGFRVGVVASLLLYHASHVGDFSAEKIISWEATQATLAHKFNLRGRGQGYTKHNTLPYDDLPRDEDAARVVRHLMQEESTSPIWLDVLSKINNQVIFK